VFLEGIDADAETLVNEEPLTGRRVLQDKDIFDIAGRLFLFETGIMPS
jgi:hypothetical protein